MPATAAVTAAPARYFRVRFMRATPRGTRAPCGPRRSVGRRAPLHPYKPRPPARRMTPAGEFSTGPPCSAAGPRRSPCTHVDPPPGSVPVLSTDGLVEAPGTGLPDPVDALAARPAGAGDLKAEGLADVLVDDVRRGAHRGDDVTVPVPRAR
ncbi:SpoIIE family protein phosphatase [Streptomyces sp. SMS_SU21]|uniref:SpoIIE family protein phosphatase n=1 Tax=Streptomyces sp. SMS_SU21 TaxID=2069440 RepID=UPI000C8816E6|nr:SpoIIE family protein phosphatase [Streptomyces sp. SMS_SU21]